MQPTQVDLKELSLLADEGLLSTQQHPTDSLLIHNYTARCQYARAWTPTLLQCRGLITDREGNVVARPFPKFFNLSEHDPPTVPNGFVPPPINWQQGFTCTRKVDGSLGVLYPSSDGPQIATRDSFKSEQAARANQMLAALDVDAVPVGVTVLFEIIYPENRIVVDYGGRECLVFLEAIETASGTFLSLEAQQEIAEAIGCEHVEHFPFMTPEAIQQLSGMDRTNDEGIVVRFDDGTRVKVKYAEYVRLHKLLTGINARSVWEILKDGRSVDELLDHVPDEFNQWVQGTVSDLQAAFSCHVATAERLFSECNVPGEPRKDFAAKAKLHGEYAPVLFKMLDARNFDDVIWNMVYPEPSPPFACDAV